MKKLSILFAAMIAMVATSCFQADVEDINLGEEGLVTFTINAPGIGSRAINDGTGAKKLTYAIYDAEWKYLSQTTIDKAFASNLTEVISLRLVKNKTYNFVFWAQNPNANCYELSLGTTVGVVVAPTVEVKYDTAVANDETRDAFFGQLKGLKVDGTVNEPVILTRPFAQINFATNHQDVVDAEAAGYKEVKDIVTSFTTRAYTKLNLADGGVDPESETDVTFDFVVNPSEPLVLLDESNSYDWLAMNYILVPAKESSLSTCSMTAQLTNQEDITIEYPMAPAKRNWRTNLVGNLLTEQAVITVKIDPVPEDEFPKTEAQKLAAIAAVGGAYTLTEDMELTNPLIVLGDLTLNLNGKTISANYNKSVGAVIKNNATLTLIGGTVSSLGENGGSAIQNNGTMIVENATLNGAPNANGGWPSYAVNNTGNLTLNNVTITSYHGGVASYNDGAVATLNDCVLEMSGIAGFTSHGFYTYSNGAIVVNGGNYANRATDQNSTGGSVINGAVEVLAGSFSGRIENYYGTPVLKGGTYTVKPNARFVAEGYVISTNANGTYTVTPGVKLDNNADLDAAIANAAVGSTVILPSNITETITLGEVKGVTIEAVATSAVRFVTTADSKVENVTIKNLDFNFVTGAGQANGACVVINKDAQIENLVLENCDFVGDGNKNSYGIYGQNPTANIVVKNSNFTNLGYCVQATSGGGYESLTIENCVFEGIISWAILPQYGYNGDLTITGCTFNNTVGGLVKTGAFNGSTFTFTNNTITNSVGHDGKDSKWFEVNASAATKVISGNTKDGADWTPASAEGLQ